MHLSVDGLPEQVQRQAEGCRDTRDGSGQPILDEKLVGAPRVNPVVRLNMGVRRTPGAEGPVCVCCHRPIVGEGGRILNRGGHEEIARQDERPARHRTREIEMDPGHVAAAIVVLKELNGAGPRCRAQPGERFGPSERIVGG